ncbi:hypothetical protein CHS0354_023744 [Potamilus streckersoni]|uniref:biotin synthase n=1 Tax=Potamilus streckersoni TaxID=2493646 RepID=A0AAE0VL17_9BIVA|nr:hypothetical protein CHS0354_023744 [Potamilus streckersoni]
MNKKNREIHNVRNDWQESEVSEFYNIPLLELVFKASVVHNVYHKVGEVQVSSLLSVKTGGCIEDCAYCPQAARYSTEIKVHPLLSLETVVAAAQQAKEGGASRFCMGAAWREVRENKDFERVLEMVSAVNELGMEVCCTMGMLNESQAERLAQAGLYAYNHNLDTSPENYENIITTRTYNDRLETLSAVRKAGITVCCGGIVGLGETKLDRIKFLHRLATLPTHPQSVPINRLVPVKGTPLESQEELPFEEFLRTIAVARIIMPLSDVRLSAGRLELSDSEQALCFLAGANSVFSGNKLLTTPNPKFESDKQLFEKFGLITRKPFQKETNIESALKENRIEAHLANELAKRRSQGILRSLTILKEIEGTIDFFSNDYLGLAKSNGFGAYLEDGGKLLYQRGSTGSRLLSGNTNEAMELEEKIAHFHNAEAAILFNSGYDANLGLISSITTRHDVVFYDELCHRSMLDGLKLSYATNCVKFNHNDIDDLAKKLNFFNQKRVGNFFVLAEAVYSMDGDVSELQALVTLAEKYDAGVIVDEAHAIGVIGDNGVGLSQSLGLEKQILARIYTYGKAPAAHGASVVGSDNLRKFLINFSTPLIYSTALPRHSLATIDFFYDFLQTDEFERQKLKLVQNIQRFKRCEKCISENGFVLLKSYSPIQAIVVGDVQKARLISSMLEEKGIVVKPIVSPTVAIGKERLRVCLHSFNYEKEIDLLASLIKKALNK